MSKDGVYICTYKGFNVTNGTSECGKIKLFYDAFLICTQFLNGCVFLGNVSNFWSAYAVYPVNITKENSNRTNLLFYGGSGFVAVTIDWTKQGNRVMKCLR